MYFDPTTVIARKCDFVCPSHDKTIRWFAQQIKLIIVDYLIWGRGGSGAINNRLDQGYTAICTNQWSICLFSPVEIQLRPCPFFTVTQPL
ncbi:hypothetical protein L596_003558 [Steinernema carpocapsae]|uniref:Uncharacterized protein n=1 Tax=Steinernema carpocapsae TaxID=34508 RepID=A0A4V6I825_STECR|nr:hypothetical protein L596_003558 [Steinernema carpocapsae]